MLELLSIDESAEQRRSTLSVNGRALSRAALNKALYWLADEFSLSEQSSDAGDESHYLLVLTVRSDQDLQEAIGSIRRALLDFAVRERVEAQTSHVRTEIVTAALKALSRGNP